MKTRVRLVFQRLHVSMPHVLRLAREAVIQYKKLSENFRDTLSLAAPLPHVSRLISEAIIKQCSK